MSEDYVNQLTLNFLISKTQLDKLHKKRINEREQNLKSDKEIFREEISKLFNDLMNGDAPLDLLSDVKDSFDYFVTKSVYYFKTSSEIRAVEEAEEDKGIQEDDNYDDNDVDEDVDDDNDDDNVDEDTGSNDDCKNGPKLEKDAASDKVHKLPLDWFKNTRQNYKMTQILPRKKEISLDSEKEEKKTIKNINYKL